MHNQKLQDPFMKPTTYTLRTKFKLSGGTARATIDQYDLDIKNIQRIKNKQNQDVGTYVRCVLWGLLDYDLLILYLYCICNSTGEGGNTDSRTCVCIG